LKLNFWLLDINTEIQGESTELWLWGITESGDRVLVVDRHFAAYFYAIVEEGFDAVKVAETIKETYGSALAGSEVVGRRFFGKPATAIKISCKDASQTGKLAKQIRKIVGVKDCLEDDIRAAMRYLIDNNLSPCNWLEAEVTEEENVENVRAAKVYSARAPPKQLDRTDIPALRMMGFSMICYSREGSPKADRNPVLILSTVASNGEEHQFIAGEDTDDKTILAAFIDYIRQYDPDVITSYGGNAVDWNYLRGSQNIL
jgi:DNA polymerase I